MKKIIKNNLLGFVLGAIIFGSIGVYAAVQYTASQITYNKNGQATVDAALNDLYSKSKIEFDNVGVENSAGTISSSSRTVSKQLSKGKYIIVFLYSMTSPQYASESFYSTISEGLQNLSFSSTSNNTVINKLSMLRTNGASSGTVGGEHGKMNFENTIYYVEITDSSDTISASVSDEYVTEYAVNNISMQILKIK